LAVSAAKLAIVANSSAYTICEEPQVIKHTRFAEKEGSVCALAVLHLRR